MLKIKNRKHFNREEWYEFEEDIKFKLRSFPLSKASGDNLMELAPRAFCYCIVDWEGIVDDESGKKLPLTDDNKLLLYDHYPEVQQFISTKIGEIAKLQSDELKN